MAIEQALEAVLLNIDEETEITRTLWFITDSQSTICLLEEGPGTQLNVIGRTPENATEASEHSINTVFQWVPGPRGIVGNKVEGEAAKLDHVCGTCSIDMSTQLTR